MYNEYKYIYLGDIYVGAQSSERFIALKGIQAALLDEELGGTNTQEISDVEFFKGSPLVPNREVEAWKGC